MNYCMLPAFCFTSVVLVYCGLIHHSICNNLLPKYSNYLWVFWEIFSKTQMISLFVHELLGCFANYYPCLFLFHFDCLWFTCHYLLFYIFFMVTFALVSCFLCVFCSYEVDIVCHLLKAECDMAEWKFLPSLLHLHESHVKLSSWCHIMPTLAKEVSMLL